MNPRSLPDQAVGAHRHGAQLPPQSTPFSSWFITPSLHEGSRHMPAQQTALSQLAPVLQPRPAGQGGQGGPPQSTPVSSPFCTRSSHAGGAQRSPSQALLLQSALDLQDSPMMQGRHGPPQSLAVSPSARSTASFVQ